MLDARIPSGLGEALRSLERRAGARVILIRRSDRRASGGTSCFAVETGPGHPWLGRARLERVEDAGELDPRDRSAFETSEAPLIVVCTHGRRDPCCAERGRPLARATSEAFPEETWESTHVGGDRFAGNLVAFPHGLYFGRVEPARGRDVVQAYADGLIALDFYRGRSSLPMPVQAAEVHLRRELGLDAIDDVTLVAVGFDGDSRTATFLTSSGRYLVRIENELGEPMRLTCHSDDEEQPTGWRVSSFERA